MASLDAKLEKYCCASLPHVPCNSTIRGMQVHLVSLVVFLLTSAASRHVAPAANNVFVLRLKLQLPTLVLNKIYMMAFGSNTTVQNR